MNYLAGFFLSYLSETQSFYMLHTVMNNPKYDLKPLFIGSFEKFERFAHNVYLYNIIIIIVYLFT